MVFNSLMVVKGEESYLLEKKSKNRNTTTTANWTQLNILKQKPALKW